MARVRNFEEMILRLKDERDRLLELIRGIRDSVGPERQDARSDQFRSGA